MKTYWRTWYVQTAHRARLEGVPVSRDYGYVIRVRPAAAPGEYGKRPGCESLDAWCKTKAIAEHAVQVERADEVKYVRHPGQALPKPHCTAAHYLLSPAFTTDGVDRAALAWVIHLCKEHPTWRLSMQQHKLWGVR